MVLFAELGQLLHELLDSVVLFDEGFLVRVDLKGLFVKLAGLLFDELVLFAEFGVELVDFELEFVEFLERLLVADSLLSVSSGLFLLFCS